MIKSLTVTNHLDESINIVLGDLDKSGFLITRIEGLGPCKATINSTEMATGDGSIFNSSRLEPRNIVIYLTFDYYHGQSIEELRHKSYKFFPIKQKIKLQFHLDNRNCEIEGVVESNEPTIFSQREGTQISVMCPDPYFYSSGEGSKTVTEFGSIGDGFEFKYDPELGYGVIFNDAKSLEEVGTPTLEFGTIKITDKNYVTYYGDSETGINIEIQALNQVGDITIANSKENKTMVLRASKIDKITGHPFDHGDLIYISTIKNKKSVQLLRQGKFYNILNCLDKDTNWFKLVRGDNEFNYATSSGEIKIVITNSTLYEGV